jgi:hypothetical protein
MAKNGIVTPYDDNGYPAYAAFTEVVSATAGLQTVKSSPGRLMKIVVTTTLTAADGNLTFYDNAQGQASGTVLAVVAQGTVAGTIIDVNMPALNGISANGANSAAGAVTVGYS